MDNTNSSGRKTINFLEIALGLPEKSLAILKDWEKRPPYILDGKDYIIYAKNELNKYKTIPDSCDMFMELFGIPFPFNNDVRSYFVHQERWFEYEIDAVKNGAGRVDLWMYGKQGFLCFDRLMFCIVTGRGPFIQILKLKLVDFIKCDCCHQIVQKITAQLREKELEYKRFFESQGWPPGSY